MISARRLRGGYVLTFFVLLAVLYYYLGALDLRHGKVTLALLPSGKVVRPSVPNALKLSKSLSSDSTSSTSKSEPTKAAEASLQTSHPSTDPADVLLIFKTGASTIWRRMPLHLTTTLANERVPNSVVYSDLAEQLASDIDTIDTLSNVSSLLQHYDPSAYDSYREMHSLEHINTYREHARLFGDEPQTVLTGSPPGWQLDRYKFLPMLTHAQQNWPGLKWYIYIEDDTFVFWNNVLRWLATLSPDTQPAYYGAYSGDGDETFAQGGSGLVFSRSLMQTVFGGERIPDLKKYGNYSASTCCGDIILGKVLRDYEIHVNRGEFGSASFRPDPPWNTGFEDFLWCSPVFTFHHLHQRDLVQLSQLERKHGDSSDASRPILFRDVYNSLISPLLTNSSLDNWDNFASKYILKLNSTSSVPQSVRVASRPPIFEDAFRSPQTCATACLAFPVCLSWRHDLISGTCALDSVVRLGRELDPPPAWATKTEVSSGWMLERIEKTLLGNKCEILQEPWSPT